MRKARALAALVEPPLDDGTPGAFTRGYARANETGMDPLEALDAIYECSAHGVLWCEVCERGVPSLVEKAA